MSSLKKLRKKIESLESEKAGLLDEIETLKKAAKAKADSLENEVAALKEEVKAFKELLSDTKQ